MALTPKPLRRHAIKTAGSRRDIPHVAQRAREIERARQTSACDRLRAIGRAFRETADNVARLFAGVKDVALGIDRSQKLTREDLALAR